MSHASRFRTARGSSTEPTFLREGGASNDDLRKLGLEYVALQLQLKSFIETQHQLWPDQAWTEELEMRWSRWIDPLRERMVEIRWEAAELKAIDLAGLKAKAAILHDTVENDPNDVRSQLTISLCEDLISFLDATCAEDRHRGLAERASEQIEASTVD